MKICDIAFLMLRIIMKSRYSMGVSIGALNVLQLFRILVVGCGSAVQAFDFETDSSRTSELNYLGDGQHGKASMDWGSDGWAAFQRIIRGNCCGTNGARNVRWSS